MSRIAPAQQAKWKEISTMPYAAQCKWVLNGFWAQLEAEAENVWTWCETFVRLDLMGPDKKGRDGCDLDEFWSHKFLETLGETMTVIEMREKFRKIDADFNKRMSMIEWLAYRYNLKISDVIDAPQGSDVEQMAKAQSMVDAAQVAVDNMNKKLADSTKAAEVALAAEQENKKALDELRAQEAAFENKKAELTKIKEDQSLGVVRRNKAANELDQMLSEDPLPLRKAKINQAATVKKSEKARIAAEEAKARAEAAVREAESKFQEALDYLEKVKRAGGVAKGDIWWMQREITEKKKYLPASKQK